MIKTETRNGDSRGLMDTTKYDIKQHYYPEDLYDGNGVYGGNYVVFYINVPEDSRLFAKDKTTAVVDNIPPRIRSQLAEQNFNGMQAATGGVAIGAGAGGVSGIVTSVARLISGRARFTKSDFVQELATIATGGAVLGGLATGVVIDAAGGGVFETPDKKYRQQKRLKTAIALHIPNNLAIRYSTAWQDENTMAFQAAATISREMGKSMSLNSGALRVAADVAASAALTRAPIIAAGLSAMTGLAGNPKKEQIFQNVNFREFSFEYTFSPRSSDEAKKVLQIIEEFKFHMHPEFKDEHDFIFIYPSEFDIVYYQGTEENLSLHRHTSCVLKDLNVNYTPNGNFNTFYDGMPTQINVTMTFLELAILTKKQIGDNF